MSANESANESWHAYANAIVAIVVEEVEEAENVNGIVLMNVDLHAILDRHHQDVAVRHALQPQTVTYLELGDEVVMEGTIALDAAAAPHPTVDRHRVRHLHRDVAGGDTQARMPRGPYLRKGGEQLVETMRIAVRESAHLHLHHADAGGLLLMMMTLAHHQTGVTVARLHHHRVHHHVADLSLHRNTRVGCRHHQTSLLMEVDRRTTPA